MGGWGRRWCKLGAQGQGTRGIPPPGLGGVGCNVLRPKQRPCGVQATLSSDGQAGNGTLRSGVTFSCTPLCTRPGCGHPTCSSTLTLPKSNSELGTEETPFR